MTHAPPTLREQLPRIRRWSTIALTSVALTLLGGWAFGAWSLPKMALYVSGNFEVDDGTREREADVDPGWRGSRGTRVCFGCRSRREIHREFGADEVLSEVRGPCARWVFEQLPTHLHAWTDEGCWSSFTDQGDGTSIHVIGCGPSVDHGIGDDLWLRYLQAHLADDLDHLVLTATIGGAEASALMQRVRAWGAEQDDEPDKQG